MLCPKRATDMGTKACQLRATGSKSPGVPAPPEAPRMSSNPPRWCPHCIRLDPAAMGSNDLGELGDTSQLDTGEPPDTLDTTDAV